MPETTAARSRGEVIGRGGRWLAEWSLRLLLIVGALWVLDILLAKAWVIVLPILFATIAATVLWPVSGWLQRRRFPPAAAAVTTMIAAFAIIAGVIAGIVPSIMGQIGPLVDRTTEGIRKVQDWVTGPPLNVEPDQIDNAVDALTHKLQSSASTIAEGVFSGVATAGEMIVTVLLIVVLTFFFIKDGPKFLPWLRRAVGGPVSTHAEEVLGRMWTTLSGFMRVQAIVALINAVIIGIALLILDVPLAGVLAVITFFGGFVPIVGAFVAGALAVLVALVASGLMKALIVLIVILVIMQLEGNVWSPMLQSQAMELHPAIVLLAVTAGGSLWGIIGAFLAVPVAAVIAVLFRYIDERIVAHTDGETPPPGDGPGHESGHSSEHSLLSAPARLLARMRRRPAGADGGQESGGGPEPNDGGPEPGGGAPESNDGGSEPGTAPRAGTARDEPDAPGA